MFQQCHSCGMPLTGNPEARGNFCQYCSDDSGTLKPREEVQAGIAQWLKQWTPDQDVDFMGRAASYMQAMPAWAGKKQL